MPLKIAIWNANELARRRNELESFLSIEISKYFSDTFFYSKMHLKIHRYQMYSTQHPVGKAHERIGILMKSNI